MERKKFICDFIEKHFTTKRFFIITCILMAIGCIVSFQINKQTYLKELSLYSERDYNYLNEIAENTWNNENKTLNFSNLPDNVHVNNFIYDKEQITFNLTLRRDFWFVSSPITNVIISEKTDNLQISNPPKEKATSKLTLIIISICLGLLAVLIPLLFIYIIIFTIDGISSIRKKHYYDKKLVQFKSKQTYTLKNNE